MNDTTDIATEKCEKILKDSKSYNIEHSILPSANAVIERLLSNRENMKAFYNELYESLSDQQISFFLDVVIRCTAFWNHENAATSRLDKKDLINTNKEIGKLAKELVALLEKREDLHNHSGFYSNTHYSIADMILDASKNNYLFEGYIKDPLDQLNARFDLKYWPTISDVVMELSKDAERAEVMASDTLTDVSTTSSRPSKVDFLRALILSINENKERAFGLIPSHFELSNKSYAEVMNCALGLSPDDLVDAGYVKREKQRQRESKTSF